VTDDHDRGPRLDLPRGSPVVVRRRVVTGAARVDGRPVRLPVAALGAPDAPALVLAHGVGSSARFLAAAFAAPVLAAGYRLVVFDQRGHGDATPCRDVGDHHLDAYVADLTAVVTSVPGPVGVVGGVSLGGHAAVRATGPWPRLVCSPGWTGTASRGEGPHAAVAAEVRGRGLTGVIDRIAADDHLPRWLHDTLVTDYRRHDPASLTAALLALDGADGPSVADVAASCAPDGPGLAVVGWPDDPGHPLAVADHWAELAGTEVVTITLAALDEDLHRFGDAAVAALRRLDPERTGDIGPPG
jgi:pimeloyl-ACP methyl ester carboxylesterase